jgi:glycosyltransferase involved in cell wall biosynthesis
MPEVAVIIPARDPGLFLNLALQSVVEQTFSDWEAVVVDDGSKEDLGWVACIDARVRLIEQTHRGPSSARNAAIEASSAPLLAFLDADDTWMPTKLHSQVLLMRAHDDTNLVDTEFEQVNDSGTRIGGGFVGHHRTYLDLLSGCGICLSTVMLRRRALQRVGGFDPRLLTAQDWDLWLRISELGAPNLRVEEVLCQYRVHEGSLSQDYGRTFVAGSRVLRTHLRRGRRSHDPAVIAAARVGLRDLRRRSGAQAYDRARVALHAQDFADAAIHLAAAGVLAPAYTVPNLFRRLAG